MSAGTVFDVVVMLSDIIPLGPKGGIFHLIKRQVPPFKPNSNNEIYLVTLHKHGF